MFPTKIRVLGLIFPSFNILDLTGPCEVFGNSGIPVSDRIIDIASASETCTSSEGVKVQRTLSFTALLDNIEALSSCDILLVPGAAAQYIDDALADDKGLLQLIKTFAGLKEDVGKKWLFSVCTGAAFFRSAGVLGGKTATTHWGYLDKIRQVCIEAGEDTSIVRKRFVSVGTTDSGVRIVTAGGVSCGIDAALWIVSEKLGLEKAARIAKVIDYDWKYVKVEVTEGWIV